MDNYPEKFKLRGWGRARVRLVLKAGKLAIVGAGSGCRNKHHFINYELPSMNWRES